VIYEGLLVKTMMTIQITALAAAIALAGCSSNPEKQARVAPQELDAKPGQAVIAPDSPQLKQIRTEMVEPVDVPIGDVSAPGKVEANQNRLSNITLPLAGRLAKVFVKMGDYVRQGQPLVVIEGPDADSAVAVFQQAQAALTQARSALAKARTDLDRQKDLFEHGAVPQKEVLNAEAVTVQASTAVDQAQATVEQARQRLHVLGIGPSSFGQGVTVIAPISGKVLSMSVVQGEFRNDLSSPVMTIADLSSVWVTSDVPETAIRLVKPGAAVSIALAAYPGETFRGRVTLIGDTVDPQTRTVKVRAEHPNPDGRLKPEMFGTVQLAEQTEKRPTVPAAAVVAMDGSSAVWRENSRGVFEKIPVTTGVQVGNRITIISGLSAKDRVVVDGVMLLAENQGAKR
jgi:cobalt-zinc-cadmium efflux system membrane fusion protein